MAGCEICAGEGFCSCLLNSIIFLTLFFHVLGILSPHWMCDGDNCDLRGIYYTCIDNDCESEVPNKSVLTLAVIVLISIAVLAMLFCCVLNCTSYKYSRLTSALGLFIGGWYIITEIFTVAILITIAVKFDTIGWSAYVFAVPGIIGLGLVIFVVIYMWCNPSITVRPV